jgi:hypothetical protein
MTMTEHGNGRHSAHFVLSSTDLSSLKTRERYVQLSEQKLEEKKKHCEYEDWRYSPVTNKVDVEVVQAFQSALKLLGA